MTITCWIGVVGVGVWAWIAAGPATKLRMKVTLIATESDERISSPLLTRLIGTEAGQAFLRSRVEPIIARPAPIRSIKVEGSGEASTSASARPDPSVTVVWRI